MPDMTASQLRTVLFSTEDGNNRDALNTFSFAGGQSTYSFGLLQFDVGTNHGNVQNFLSQNGFSRDQINQLSQHGGLSSGDLSILNKQLQSIPNEKIDKFNDDQLASSVAHIRDVVSTVSQTNPAIGKAIAESPELQLALADYDNQYNLDLGGSRNGMLAYLEGREVSLPKGTVKLGDSIGREDIQRYINNTAEAVGNPTGVANREARLVIGLNALELGKSGSHVPPSMPAQSPVNPQRSSSSSDASSVGYGGNASAMAALASSSNLLYDNSGRHSCVTQVLTECDQLGIKTFDGGTQEAPDSSGPGNYVRGAMTQMINNGNWESVELPGAKKETLNGSFGSAEVYTLSASAYEQLVSAGKIPSGAVVYQTKYGTFNNSQTYGNDMGITIDGGRTTHNYADMGTLVEGNDSQCRVSLMVPTAAFRGSNRTGQESPHAGGSHGMEGGLIMEGDKSHAVGDMQLKLQSLGYAGVDGHRLAADNDFGKDTRYAVEAFQKDHNLSVDGVVGSKTVAALNQSFTAQKEAKAVVKPSEAHSGEKHVAESPLPSPKEKTLLMSDPHSPDYALFKQAWEGVQKIDAGMGRTSDQASLNLAASLALTAKAQGLSRIDAVGLSEDGSGCFAVQQSSPLTQVAKVGTAEAVHTPIQQSSANAASLAMPAVEHAQMAATVESARLSPAAFSQVA